MLFFYLQYFYMTLGALLVINSERVLKWLKIYLIFNRIFLFIACALGVWNGLMTNIDFCVNHMWLMLRFSSFVMTVIFIVLSIYLTMYLKKMAADPELVQLGDLISMQKKSIRHL